MQTETNAITLALSKMKHKDLRSILFMTDFLSTLEPKSFFFQSVWKLTFELKMCLIFCDVFPIKNCHFDVISQNVSEFLSEVSEFSGSSFPKMAKKSFWALEKVRGSNLHADWTPHIRDSQIQKITWIYCLQLSSVVGNKAADKLAGEAAISDQINLLDPHSFNNLVTSALDDNPLPSSSHTLECVKYSSELRGDGARSQLCCLTRRQTNQLLCCIVKVPTLRWTLGGGGKMWICPSCNNADPCPNKYSQVKRGQYACKVIY